MGEISGTKTRELVLVAYKDRKDNRLLCKHLKKRGYSTMSAYCRTEAAVMLQMIPPDMLLLEAALEDASDVVDVLRHNRRTQEVPVVFVKKDGCAPTGFQRCN